MENSEDRRPDGVTEDATAGGLTPRTWLLVIAAISLLIIVAGSFPGFGRASDRQDSTGASGVERVEINGTSTAITVLRGTGNEISAEIDGSRANAHHLVVDRTGSTVFIDVNRRWRLFGFFPFGSARLTVTLPAADLEELQVGVSSGSVTVSGLTLQEADISASSGRILLQQLEVRGELSARTSSGSMRLENTIANSYLLRSSSGRIEAHDLPGGSVDAASSSGSIEISTSRIREAWELRSSSGRITVRLTERPDDLRVDFQGSSGGWDVNDAFGFTVATDDRNRLLASTGDAGPMLRVRTSSGGFRLQ